MKNINKNQRLFGFLVVLVIAVGVIPGVSLAQVFQQAPGQQWVVPPNPTPNPRPAFCRDFNMNLGIGSEGDEVANLKTALQLEGFTVPGIGTYGEGNVFSEEVAAAVTGFQQRYKDEILAPLGLQYGTGYVGKATRTKLNALYGCTNRKPKPIITPNPTYRISPSGDLVLGKEYTFSMSIRDAKPRAPVRFYLQRPDGSMFFDGVSRIMDFVDNVYTDEKGNLDLSARLRLGGQGQEGRWVSWVTVGGVALDGAFDRVHHYVRGSGNSSQPSVNVLSPNGGEKLMIGKEYEIKWDYNSLGVAEDGIYDKKIYLVRDKGGDVGPSYCDVGQCGAPQGFIDIAGGWDSPFNLSSKSLKWLVPNYIVPGDDYRIGITFSISEVRHAESMSSAPFSIVSGTGGNQPPVISGVSGPTNLRAGETGTWTVTASDPQRGPLAYSVAWGDEMPTEVPPMAPLYSLSQTATFTHAYNQPGTYTPSFIVVNSAGLSARTSISVQVGEVPAPRASLTIATDPQTPLGRDIRQGETDVPLLSAAFTAGTASDVTITGMGVLFEWPSGPVTAVLRDISLWDGGTLLARTPLVTTNPILSVNLTIPRGTTKTLTIKGSVLPTAPIGGGLALYLYSGSVTVGSPSGTVVTGSAVGNTFSIVPPLGQMTLTVSRTGGGTGTVTSAPVGIDCGATCAANFAQGSTVTLTAAPAAGSRFTGWTGDCMGMNPTPTCTLSMTANRTAGASFVLSQQETRASLTIATDPQTPVGRDIRQGETDVPLLSAAFTAGTASDVTITGINVSFDSREGRDIVLPSDISLWDGDRLLARTQLVNPIPTPIFSSYFPIPRGATKTLTVKGSVSPAAPVGGDMRLYLYSFSVTVGSPSGTVVTGSAYGNTFTVVSRQAPQPPVISGVSGPTNLRAGETGTWTITASDPQGGALSYFIDWGEVPPVPPGKPPARVFSQTATFTHSYSTAGTYTVRATVLNDKGLSAETSITVNVGTPTPLPPLSLTAAVTAPLLSAVIDSFPSTDRTIAQFALYASGEAVDVSSLTFQSGDSVGLGRLQLRNMRIEVAIDNQIIPSFGGRSREEVDKICAASCTFSGPPFRIADGKVAIVNVIAEVVSASRGARYAQPFTMTWARGEGAVTHRGVTLSGGVKGPDFMVDDTTPPTVSVSHSPASPLASDVVDITTTASDESGIYRIDIYVDGDVTTKTCYGVTSCTYSSGFPVGAHAYYATATDASVNLNVGRDPAAGTKSFRVPREPRERIGPPYTQ